MMNVKHYFPTDSMKYQPAQVHSMLIHFKCPKESWTKTLKCYIKIHSQLKLFWQHSHFLVKTKTNNG